MPWPPTESNVDALEQWIRDYYATTGFNVCEHQALQAMTGPPLKIRVEEGAEPRVVHQPIPLPHHWRQEVLDGLERDYRPSYSIGLLSHISKRSPMIKRLHILKKLYEGEISGGNFKNMLHNVLVCRQ